MRPALPIPLDRLGYYIFVEQGTRVFAISGILKPGAIEIIRGILQTVYGGVAQSVEQGTHKPCVTSSILVAATTRCSENYVRVPFLYLKPIQPCIYSGSLM